MNEPKKAGWLSRLAVVASLLLLGYVIFVCCTVTWQMYTYRTVATEMAAALASRYPNLTFIGSAGYERTMGITVSELPDEGTQQAIRAWLAEELTKRGMQPRLHLVFLGHDVKEWNYDGREGQWTEAAW